MPLNLNCFSILLLGIFRPRNLSNQKSYVQQTKGACAFIRISSSNLDIVITIIKKLIKVPNHNISQKPSKGGFFSSLLRPNYIPGFSVFIATGVVLFHNPSQTSPNWPLPSFLSKRRLDLSISHLSWVVWARSAVKGLSIWKHKNKCWKQCYTKCIMKFYRKIGHFSSF